MSTTNGGPDPDVFLPWNGEGRRFVLEDVVGLGDADATGRLRLDGVARLLQGISARDSDDSGFLDPWVLRRLELHFDGTPTFGEYLDLATWCSGAGAAIAERRTTIEVGAGRGRVGTGTAARIEAAALWVHLDAATGGPAALPERFARVYGASAAGRRVRGRLTLPPPPADGPGRFVRPWPLRTTDIDLVQHVHNAAYWDAIEAARRAAWSDRPVVAATLEFRGGIDLDDAVDVVWSTPTADDLSVWLVIDGDPRAAAAVRGA